MLSIRMIPLLLLVIIFVKTATLEAIRLSDKEPTEIVLEQVEEESAKITDPGLKELLDEAKSIIEDLNSWNIAHWANGKLEMLESIFERLDYLVKKVQETYPSKQTTAPAIVKEAAGAAAKHSADESDAQISEHVHQVTLGVLHQLKKPNQKENKIDVLEYVSQIVENIKCHLHMLADHNKGSEKTLKRRKRSVETSEESDGNHNVKEYIEGSDGLKKEKKDHKHAKDPKKAGHEKYVLENAFGKAGYVLGEAGVLGYWAIGQAGKFVICIARKLTEEECKSLLFRGKWSLADRSDFLAKYEKLTRGPSPKYLEEQKQKKIERVNTKIKRTEKKKGMLEKKKDKLEKKL